MPDGVADECDPSSRSRERILDAGLKIFGEKGYAGATTKEIALRAGVNEVTLFRTFHNKMGLFDVIIKERFPKAQLLKELHFDRGLGMRTVLVENSLRLLNILHANRDLVRMVVLDLPRRGGATLVDPISTAFIGPLSGYFASQSEADMVRDIEPEMAAEILYGTLRSFFIDHYLFHDAAPEPSCDHRFINTAVDLYIDGIGRVGSEEHQKPGRKRPR